MNWAKVEPWLNCKEARYEGSIPFTHSIDNQRLAKKCGKAMRFWAPFEETRALNMFWASAAVRSEN
jgi:hypothetical protein